MASKKWPIGMYMFCIAAWRNGVDPCGLNGDWDTETPLDVHVIMSRYDTY